MRRFKQQTKKHFFPKPLLAGLLLLPVAVGIYVLAMGQINKDQDVAIRTTDEISIRSSGSLTTTDLKTKQTSNKRIANAAKLQAKPQQIVEYTADPVSIPNMNPNAAVLYWNQEGDEGVVVEVRTKNGNTWSDWTEVDTVDGGKDGTKNKSGEASSLIIANKIDDLQYRIKLTGSETAPSSVVGVDESTVQGIDSRQGPTGKATPLEIISSMVSPSASASSLAPPSVISREAWGNPKPNSSAWKPEYAKLRQVVVHHTATTESSNSYADVRAIWQYHANSLGWGDIGYHYIVDSKGRIFEGRLHDPKYEATTNQVVIGGHVYGHNSGTIGISAIGNYNDRSLTSSTRESIARIAGFRMAQHRLNPNSRSNTIVGHHQLLSTSCPGRNIISQLGTIRSMIYQHYKSYVPFFPFKSLGGAHWKDLEVEAYKYDPKTGRRVAGPFAVNQRIDFVDTVVGKGVLYYRTATDAGRYRHHAFKASELKEIQPIPFDQPRYMHLNRPAAKDNPITSSYDVSRFYPNGTKARFIDKVLIDNVWYYRTETDYTNGSLTFFSRHEVSTINFESVAPRYMQLKPGATVLDPHNPASPGEPIEAGSHVLFDSSITTDQIYLRSAQDTGAGQSRAIAAEYVEEIPFTDLPSTQIMKPLKVIPKYDVFTKTVTETTIDPEDVTELEITQKITVDGTLYYRTRADAANNVPLGILASDIQGTNEPTPPSEPEPVPVPEPTAPQDSLELYEPLDIPRIMTLRKDTYKKIPQTGESIDRLLKAGRQIKFTTKVTIDGVMYLRTEYDTGLNINKGIERYLLQ